MSITTGATPLNPFHALIPCPPSSAESVCLAECCANNIISATVLQGIVGLLIRANFVCSKLHNIINQRESRLNLEIAIQQRKVAIASARESTSMRTLTILGLAFLPGTFLSSLFGMPFFKFDRGEYQLLLSPPPLLPPPLPKSRQLY